MSYDAFISYSHAADGRLAPAVQSGLQRLAKPWNSRRALRVFRDETGLSTNPHLWSSIVAALDESTWFVLLASPEAAASEWVDKELDHWLQTAPGNRILPVVTGGEWAWDSAAGRLVGDAVPDRLAAAFTEEPRHLDLRWARSETDLDLRNSGFRSAIADLAAPMHGVPKDDLESEDIRQQRHVVRLARGGATALTLLVVVSLVAMAFAFIQRAHANHNADVAQRATVVADSGRLAALANDKVSTQLDLALLLAVEGHRLHDSTTTRSALLTAVAYSPHLTELKNGFGDNFTAVDFSPDHKRIVVGGRDGALRVWDVRTEKPITRVQSADKSAIRAVAFSPDGKLIATGSEDSTARVWDAATLRPLFAVPHYQEISQVSFTPDSRWLALGSPTDGINMYSVPSGSKPVGRLGNEFSNDLLDDDGYFAFSPDGRTYVGGSSGVEFTARFAPGVRGLVPTAEILGSLDFKPSNSLTAVTFSPDGSKVAVGTNNGAHLIDANKRTEIGSVLTGGNDNITSLAFSADGKTLAGGDTDGSVLRWDAASGARIGAPLGGLGGRVLRVSFAGDDEIMAAGLTGVATWTLSAHSLADSELPNEELTGLAAAPDGLVATADAAGVQLWDSTRSKPARTSSITSADAGPVAVTPDGALLAVGTPSGVEFWDVAKRSKVWSVAATSFDYRRGTLAFSPDGRVLAVADPSYFSPGDVIALVDVPDRKLLRVIHANPDFTPFHGLSGLAFSPDSHTLATTGYDGVLHLWDVATGAERMRPAPAQSTALVAVVFTSDGTRVVTAGGDGSIMFWDTATGQPVGNPIVASSDPLASLAITPDATTLATISQNGGLTLWDLTTHERLGPALSIGPDTPPLALPINTEARRPSVVYTAHGTVLVTGTPSFPTGTAIPGRSTSTGVEFWDLRPESWSRKACQLAGRNLTRAEWAQYLGDRPYEQTCPGRPAGT